MEDFALPEVRTVSTQSENPFANADMDGNSDFALDYNRADSEAAPATDTGGTRPSTVAEVKQAIASAADTVKTKIVGAPQKVSDSVVAVVAPVARPGKADTRSGWMTVVYIASGVALAAIGYWAWKKFA